MFVGLSNEKRGLKAIFENKKILKILHDVRSDWDSLLHQYSVRIFNFIDTQEAFFVWKLFYNQEISLPISLIRFISEILKINLEYKDKYKNIMALDPEIWGVRPLTEEQIAYASEDVFYLIEAWNKMKNYLSNNLQEIVSFLTIMKVIDGDIFCQFKEFLIANIVYYGILNNVFSSDKMFGYYVNIDYVYIFLHIKMLIERDKNEDDNGVSESSSIIKCSMNFKIKQKMKETKRLQDIGNSHNNFMNYMRFNREDKSDNKILYDNSDYYNDYSGSNSSLLVKNEFKSRNLMKNGKIDDNCKPASPCFYDGSKKIHKLDLGNDVISTKKNFLEICNLEDPNSKGELNIDNKFVNNPKKNFKKKMNFSNFPDNNCKSLEIGNDRTDIKLFPINKNTSENFFSSVQNYSKSHNSNFFMKHGNHKLNYKNKIKYNLKQSLHSNTNYDTKTEYFYNYNRKSISNNYNVTTKMEEGKILITNSRKNN